jgi:hypothetical protein
MSGPAALEREGHVGLVYPTAQVRDETVVAFVGDGLTLDAPHFFPARGQAALVDPLLNSGRPGVRRVTSAEDALAYLGESDFAGSSRR